MNLLARFLARYARPHLRSYLLGLLFLLATTGLTVAIPTFVELAVDAMAEGDSPTAVAFAWAIIAAGLGVMVVRTLSRVLFFNPGRVIEYHLKSDLFRHLTELPRRYYDLMRPGEIVSRGTNDAQHVRGFIGFGSLQVFNVVLTLLLAIGKMAVTDWRLTLWVLLPLLLAVLVLRRAIREMFTLTRKTQEELGHLSSRVLETYGGANVLQSMNATAMAKERFEQNNAALLGVGQRLAFVIAWLLPIVDVVGNACLVLLLFVGGHMVVDGTLTPGELAAFAVLIRIVAGGLNSLGWLVNALQRGWISLGRVYEVLDAPVGSSGASATPIAAPVGPSGASATPIAAPVGPSGASATPIAAPVGPTAARATPAAARRAPSLTVSRLTFEHASHRDNGEERPALAEVSFTVEPGQTLGIFGATGAGKSTLLDLLSRVHDPAPGQISLDGQDILDLELPTLRQRVAYVPQDPWLFSQTLRENVALADDADTRDDARVEAAVKAACLSDDLASLADGLETRVGERGVMLSGGQRQRAALARAFYRDFDLLLLDDVLSAVDHNTEKRLIDSIYQTVAGQRRSATTLIVSHRVSALRHADKIIVLDRGRLIAEGRHEDLLRDTEGPYWRAWRLQQTREQDIALHTTEAAGV